MKCINDKLSRKQSGILTSLLGENQGAANQSRLEILFKHKSYFQRIY